MKKRISVLLIPALLLTSCSAPATDPAGASGEDTVISVTEENVPTECETEAVPTETASTEDETEAPPSEETTRNTDVPMKEYEHSYIHGEDGYYCTAEEGIDIDFIPQNSGMCWIYASIAAIEASYQKKHGEKIEIQPMELLDLIYYKAEGKDEGLFATGVRHRKELGGVAQFVAFRLAGGGYNGLFLEEAVMHPGMTGEQLREAVLEYGAVYVAVPDTDASKKGRIDGYMTINHVSDDPEDFDHAIAVIGWDDNFPKQYFREEASQDGAWIAYNSMTSGEYYYVSYDTYFDGMTESTMDVTGRDCPTTLVLTDEYSDVRSYDCACFGMIRTSSMTSANVFHGEGTLAAVGTYVVEPCDIKIGIRSEDLSEVIYEQSAHFDDPGYYAVKLDEPPEVKDYGISITYGCDIPVEGEEWHDDVFLDYLPVSEAGQSFLLAGDEWVDVTDPSIKEKAGIDLMPNNCCIKAIYE